MKLKYKVHVSENKTIDTGYTGDKIKEKYIIPTDNPEITSFALVVYEDNTVIAHDFNNSTFYTNNEDLYNHIKSQL